MAIISLAANITEGYSIAPSATNEINAIVKINAIEMSKRCSICNEVKELTEFCKNKNKILGVKSECKACKIIADKKYRDNNKEKIIMSNTRYYNNNKEKISLYSKKYYCGNIEKISLAGKEYSKLNNSKRAARVRNKRNSDPVYKLKSRFGSIISGAIKRSGYTKKSRTFEILGCSYDLFIKHLQRKFTKGMTLNNYGEWHLDHIIPISSATTEKDVIELNHYTNFQPLWAKDNLSKSNKIPDKHQLTLIL